MIKNIFSTHEAGRICNVHQTTIINWIEEGKLKAYITPGGHRRIKKSALLAFMKEYDMPIPGDFLRKGKTVLVVDDDPDMLDELKAALSGRGFDLDFATNGFDAARKIYSQKPDLILLDFMMPGMDGFEVCAKLRENKDVCDIPVFAVTVLKSDEDRQRIKECGVAEYIPKPVDIDRLLGLIKKALGIEYDSCE